MSEHLRPHPTQVREKRNILLKYSFRSRTTDYYYGFDFKNYCDLEFHNVTKQPTTIYPGLKGALEYVKKPVIFFTCYDVGPNEILNAFVRHVVCCMAVREGEGITVYMFDMRNLKDISAGFKEDMEKQLSEFANRPVKIVNAACTHRSNCVYLQRFKGDTEMGWCISWALLFLDYLTANPDIIHYSPNEKERTFAKLYTNLDKHLSKPRSNHFIEAYYTRLLDLSP